MGLEASCTVRYGSKTSAGTAQAIAAGELEKRASALVWTLAGGSVARSSLPDRSSEGALEHADALHL